MKMKPVSLQALVMLFAGAGLGLIAGNYLFSQQKQPEYSVVWAYENRAEIPNDLYTYLLEETTDHCHDYKGTNTVKGTHLAAVREVIDERYAWIDIGCESIQNEDAIFPVIKTEGEGWELLSAAEFWLGTDDTFEPYARCSIVDQYNISSSFVQECLPDTGDDEADLRLTSADLVQVQN